MTRAAQIYDFSLTAGGVTEILAEGSYYRILSATGALEVRRDGGSRLGPLYAGQGERDEFKRLTLRDISGAPNSGLVIVADGSFIDDRITGEVSVIDGGLIRTIGLTAFAGGASLAASPGNYSHVQLWNPVGNTKNIVLSKIHFSSATANPNPYVRYYGTALSTLAGNAQSKLMGGANSSAEIRTQQPASLLGTGQLWQPYLTASQLSIYEPKEPIVIPPNMGCVVVNIVANAAAAVSFDFYEEPT